MRIQEIFSQFVYHQPKDPLQIMIDFYFMVGYVYGTDFKDDVVDWVMKEAVKDCVDLHSKFLIKSLKYCCSAELKHITEYCNALKSAARKSTPEEAQEALKEHYSPRTFKFLVKYLSIFPLFYNASGADNVSPYTKFNHRLDLNKRNSRFPINKDSGKYLNQFKAVIATQRALNYSDTDIAIVFVEMFDDDEGWNGAFGGHAWQKIAQCMLDLLRAKKIGEKIIYCDHAYDLEHNTGIVFNKLEKFSKNGSFGWIKDELDWKRNNTSLKAFYDKVSTQLQPVVAYVSKYKYEDTILPPEEKKVIATIKQSIQGKAVQGAKKEIKVPVTSSTVKVGKDVILNPDYIVIKPNLKQYEGKVGQITEASPKLRVYWEGLGEAYFSEYYFVVANNSIHQPIHQPILFYAPENTLEIEDTTENTTSKKSIPVTPENVSIGDMVQYNPATEIENKKVGEVIKLEPGYISIKWEKGNDTHSIWWDKVGGMSTFIFAEPSKNKDNKKKTTNELQVGDEGLIRKQIYTIDEFEVGKKIIFTNLENKEYTGVITKNTGLTVSIKYDETPSTNTETPYDAYDIIELLKEGKRKFELLVPKEETTSPLKNIPLTMKNVKVGMTIGWNPDYVFQNSIPEDDIYTLTATILSFNPEYSSPIRVKWSDNDITNEDLLSAGIPRLLILSDYNEIESEYDPADDGWILITDTDNLTFGDISMYYDKAVPDYAYNKSTGIIKNIEGDDVDIDWNDGTSAVYNSRLFAEYPNYYYKPQRKGAEENLNDTFGPVQWAPVDIKEVVVGDLIRDANQEQYEVLKTYIDGVTLQRENKQGLYIDFDHLFSMGPWEKVA